MGLYHLYYAFSAFGKNTSGIALAVNETLDQASPKYKWVDKGLVLRSLCAGRLQCDRSEPGARCEGRGVAVVWQLLVGDQDAEAGPEDGAAFDERYEDVCAGFAWGRRAMGPRNPDLPPDTEAVEAPFVYHHGDYYYLFVSWDLCCRGQKSTYRTMVGRSKSRNRAVYRRSGTGSRWKRAAGRRCCSPNAKWIGPGGESLLRLPQTRI